jgi:hypothetical protein
MTGDETKVCPDCAETVKAEARVCRFCGYRFLPDNASTTAPPPSPAPRRPTRVLVWRSITVVGALILAFLIYNRVNGDGSKPFAVCTVSTSQHDVNLVITGNGADAFCASQAKKLSGSGDFYVVRTGRDLRAPDYGPTSLTIVCDVASGPLEIVVYDDGGQIYGTDYCGQFEANGWQIRSA